MNERLTRASHRCQFRYRSSRREPAVAQTLYLIRIYAL